MEDDIEESVIIEEDYYACLNVPKEATQDEITNAYRRFSRFYHPDKHIDPEKKKEADLLFSKVKRAYEVLTDPHQRAIYDTVGLKGLNTQGWEIVQRTKTPQEIREEYERLTQERKERRMQQRTNPKGSVIVNINATDILNHYDINPGYEDLETSFFPNIEITGVSMTQSIEAPLTLQDTLTLGAQVSTHNGTGSGSMSFATRHMLSTNGWVEGEFCAGNGSILTCKAFRVIIKNIYLNLDAQFKLDVGGIKVGLRSSIGMPLDFNTHGCISWNIGIAPAMSTLLVRSTESTDSSFMINLSVVNSFISGAYLWKMKKQDMKFRLYGKLGTISKVIECAAEKKVSEHSSVSATVTVGVPVGVVLKVKIIRAHQSYIFPIHLCEEPQFIPTVYATIVPFVTWFAIKKLIVDPITRHQKEKEIERQREINRNKMVENQRVAKAAVDLMKAAFSRIRTDEERRGGLVILIALYGKNADVVGKTADSNVKKPEVINVTIPVQCLIIDSQLTLHKSSKSQLSGFYDPCVGEDKVLYIRYAHRSHLHEVTIVDNEPLRLPKSAHRIVSA